jgi:hypothetical protein
MRTYVIELRVDFQTDDKYDITTEAAREMARQLLATAMMLKDKRDPQISFSSGDMFEANKDLEIITPEDLRGE